MNEESDEIKAWRAAHDRLVKRRGGFLAAINPDSVLPYPVPKELLADQGLNEARQFEGEFRTPFVEETNSSFCSKYEDKQRACEAYERLSDVFIETVHFLVCLDVLGARPGDADELIAKQRSVRAEVAALEVMQ